MIGKKGAFNRITKKNERGDGRERERENVRGRYEGETNEGERRRNR